METKTIDAERSSPHCWRSSATPPASQRSTIQRCSARAQAGGAWALSFEIVSDSSVMTKFSCASSSSCDSSSGGSSRSICGADES